ncbi:S9 family peptidase [Nocardia uniformis]|uniref:S9 family peptidase n=2 Tax=Nocardia uniformis TaxID=53432 RepID=A0A849CKN5_9NOCA|nr:S9 family peptidase [Nocardia uniformis]
MSTEKPFGLWPSGISAESVAAAAARVLDVGVDDGAIVWTQTCPADNGRVRLLRWTPETGTVDLLPERFNVRTAVHEYGGGSWWVQDGTIWFVDWRDQRLYRREPDGSVSPVSAPGDDARLVRYADGDVAPAGRYFVCVRESHRGARADDVRNEIIRWTRSAREPEILVSGPDFVAAPRLSPDGLRMAWLQWNHPEMPWDGTELWVRDLAGGGGDTLIAGGRRESVLEPTWQPDGSIYFLSDRTGWWGIYRWSALAGTEPVVRINADIGAPPWTLNGSRYAVLSDARVVFTYTRDGRDTVAVAGPDRSVTDITTPFSYVAQIRCVGDAGIVLEAGSTTSETGLFLMTLDHDGPSLIEVQAARAHGLGPADISEPEQLTIGTAAGPVHALYYPPCSRGYRGPTGDRPPLLVNVHGGPTIRADANLSLGVQFWTTRGFAFVDVNYGGSSGYGRHYRERLRGRWGEVDVEDCVAVVRHLSESERVDVRRVCVRGASAGGYTVLAALSMADTPFAAGVDYYGVADLETMLATTHKFESRYLEGLIGPFPETRRRYKERSPLSRVDRFARPLLAIHGTDDAVVPPAQSEAIVAALREKGLPVSLLLFEGEQHGIRRAENIRRVMAAELRFYIDVLKLDSQEQAARPPS